MPLIQKVKLVLLLFTFANTCYSQLSFPFYEEKLIRYEIMDSLVFDIEIEYYSAREDVQHKVLESHLRILKDSALYFVVVGSTIGEGLDCNACGSVLTLFTYSINEDGYKFRHSSHIGQYGNLGYYPLNVDFFSTERNDLLLQVSWLSTAPGGYMSEGISVHVLEDKTYTNCLFNLSLQDISKYLTVDNYKLSVDELDHNSYVTTFYTSSIENAFLEIHSTNAYFEIYTKVGAELKLIETVSKE